MLKIVFIFSLNTLYEYTLIQPILCRHLTLEIIDDVVVLVVLDSLIDPRSAARRNQIHHDALGPVTIGVFSYHYGCVARRLRRHQHLIDVRGAIILLTRHTLQSTLDCRAVCHVLASAPIHRRPRACSDLHIGQFFLAVN